MANRGGLRWETNSFYAEAQIAAVLRAIGVQVETETEAVFLAYCPFHGNHDTPSFAISKTEGLYICYNPACNRTGNFMHLIKAIGKIDDFAAKRLIAKSQISVDDLGDHLQALLDPQEEFPEYVNSKKPNYMRDIKVDFWKYGDAQRYMMGRGFEKETMKKFEVGYDAELDMICVPMHDPMGKVEVGLIRRSIEGKVFKNTPGLPSSKTLFNIHRAKKTGDAVIVVEASFSTMRLDQCGYSNAVSVLMGQFNQQHASLLNKYFNTITIMTDFDDVKKHVYKGCQKCRAETGGLCKGHNPGEELGMKIAGLLPNKRLMWAHSGGSTRFPPGIKDPDDMDDETIRYSIKNAISHFEYALDS
jgi:DNA primase